MNVLVTGGYGYIGLHTCLELLRRGDNVVIIDDHRSSSPRMEWCLAWAAKKLRLPGDILYTTKSSIEYADTVWCCARYGVDAIIHLAASSIVPESYKQCADYLINNINTTTELIRVCEKTGINKFVFSSTAAIYGDAGSFLVDKDTSSGVPSSPYTRSKLVAEECLRAFAAANTDFKHVSLRYFNACGADESGYIGENHNPETHLIPRALQAARDGRIMKIYGRDLPTKDGSCVRDYVHVSDIAVAHLRALDRIDRLPRDVYNLGTGKGHTVLEVVNKCEDVAGKKMIIKKMDRRKGDPIYLVADVSNVKEDLGWEAERDIDQAIKDAWNWHKP